MNFVTLQKRLKRNKHLGNFNYRGERTYVVLSGIHHANYDMSKVPGLEYYEERMLFFLFLLKYKKTKIIYVTSKGFNTELFNYYIGLTSKNEREILSRRKRLVHIELSDPRKICLAQKILDNQSYLEEIKSHITNLKNAMLRCYNPIAEERELAVRLGIPLFGPPEKYDFVGSKSGGRKVFKLSGVNVIPGYSYLSGFDDLCLAMAKLLKEYPKCEKLIIKLNNTATGAGNSIFHLADFLRANKKINLSEIQSNIEVIKSQFKQFIAFQNSNLSLDEYIKLFDTMGGIVELFINGKTKYSPSVQVLINTEGKPSILSTHEQILGGIDKQEYLGCSFPCLQSHRKLIVQEAKKIAEWMAKKKMVGNFGIDFVVIYDGEDKKPIAYPVEINLRKGGTTHPLKIAYFLTSARYNNSEHILTCGKTPIYYVAVDLIEGKNFRIIEPMELINLIDSRKIGFNKNTKRGVLIYMPGIIQELGLFGAICIGHSREEAEGYYKKLIRLVNSYASKKTAGAASVSVSPATDG